LSYSEKIEEKTAEKYSGDLKIELMLLLKKGSRTSD